MLQATLKNSILLMMPFIIASSGTAVSMKRPNPYAHQNTPGRTLQLLQYSLFWQPHINPYRVENQIKDNEIGDNSSNFIDVFNTHDEHTDTADDDECSTLLPLIVAATYLTEQINHRSIMEPLQPSLYNKNSSPKTLTMHPHTHINNKPYKCITCEKAFDYEGRLRIHERTHTGEKPYPCDSCPKRFAHKSNLIRHEKTQH